MKIVFLSRLYSPHVGGVEKHVENVSKMLIVKGHSVTVICEQNDLKSPLKEVKDGVKILRLPYSMRDSKLSTWKWMRQQKKLFEKADIVHAHDVYWWYFPLRLEMRNVSSFATFHGYTGVDLPKHREGWHRKLVSKFAIRTMAVGGFMNKWYGIDPDVVTYGAANTIKYPEVRKNSAVFAGRLEKDTGLMIYLKALPLIKRKIILDIYGDGELRTKAEALAINENLPVAFHGWIENAEKIFKDVRYAFCSQYLSILEAMKARRLVLAVYNNDFKKDYITCHPMSEHMLIAGNFTDLARKINSLSKEKEREMIEECYKWARIQTWAKLTGEYLKMWNT